MKPQEPIPPHAALDEGLDRHLAVADPEVLAAIRREASRRDTQLDLIPSENRAPTAVLEALANPMHDKYAEGYPGGRYYGGCGPVDAVEELATDRAKRLFGCDHVNVQPHSGVPANLAIFLALADLGDPVLGLDLAHGGHLSHGHPANITARLFDVHPYGVDPNTERIDYDRLFDLARAVRPRIIISGASSYPRTIDFARFGEIAGDVGAFHVADISHIGGLVAAGLHPSPVPHADAVMTTTHKTLRGPRGAIILCRQRHAGAIDRAVFPGVQGGPHMHTIAAKAVCFGEALTDPFRSYQRRVIENASALADELQRLGHRLVAGGTDTHLLLIDVRGVGMTGRTAESALERVGIVVNRNAIPYDPQPPAVASGIRVGSPLLTSLGMGVAEMVEVARLIDRVLRHADDASIVEEAAGGVRTLLEGFTAARSAVGAGRVSAR